MSSQNKVSEMKLRRLIVRLRRKKYDLIAENNELREKNKSLEILSETLKVKLKIFQNAFALIVKHGLNCLEIQLIGGCYSEKSKAIREFLSFLHNIAAIDGTTEEIASGLVDERCEWTAVGNKEMLPGLQEHLTEFRKTKRKVCHYESDEKPRPIA